jgi:sodium pump decarboxylase gamma subunit
MDTWGKLEIGVVMTVLGMGIVFIVLFFLAVILNLMEKVCSPRPRKVQAPVPTRDAAAAAAAPAPGDPNALVAVITAAIATCTGAETPLAIRSIRKTREDLPAWGRMGRQEQIESRKIP